MEALLFNLEIAGVAVVLIAIHRLRRLLGLTPLYVVVGLLLTFMAIPGRLSLEVPVLGGGTARYATLHLALVLATVVLVYALEGTREARRLIGAVVIMSGFLFGMRLLLSAHIEANVSDMALFGRERWTAPNFRASLVSTAALLVDGVAIIVFYQTLLNISHGFSQAVNLSIALLVAMVLDGLVYGGLSGTIDLAELGDDLVGKVCAGVAAGVPIAIYIGRQFRRFPEHLRSGVLERKALEILSLRERVETMSTALEHSRAETEHVKAVFSRYVMPDVVEEILRDASQLKLGGELREVTIVFSDIRGYSTLSEQMTPEETIGLLNEYFASMNRVIDSHRGTIIEFEGDAILTVFNAPLDQPDHAERAVSAACEMLQAVVALNRQWDDDGTSVHWRELQIATFKIRIGIHTGPVVVGNVGSETRTKYAVIGDTVNTAARIEELNKTLRTTLLISRATVEQLDEPDVDLRDLGVHDIRGRSEPVQLFTIDDLPAFDSPLTTGAFSGVLAEVESATATTTAENEEEPADQEEGGRS